MDRKVIALSPAEWNNRIDLGASLQIAYDHTHFAVTRVGNMKAEFYELLHGIRHGITSDEQVEQINKMIVLTNEITSEVRDAQAIISGIKVVIQHSPMN